MRSKIELIRRQKGIKVGGVFEKFRKNEKQVRKNRLIAGLPRSQARMADNTHARLARKKRNHDETESACKVQTRMSRGTNRGKVSSARLAVSFVSIASFPSLDDTPASSSLSFAFSILLSRVAALSCRSLSV